MGVFERDLLTGETKTLVDGIEGCAANSMTFLDDALYTPRPFEGRVVKIDLLNNNTVTDVTTGLVAPNAVKANNQGELFVGDFQAGEIYRITNLEAADTTTNREIVAVPPFGGFLDNFNFDSNDSLYVSYPTRGTIVEMTGETVESYRVVSPGDFSIAMGMALFDGILYTVEPSSIFGFDLATAEKVYAFASTPGSSDIHFPTSVVAGDDRLYLLSFISGFVVSWNVTSQMPMASVPNLTSPTDAHPFAGGLLVTNFGQGQILNITGDNLETVEVLGNYPGATFLTGNDREVYFGNYANASIYRFIADGVVLEEAELISAGHDGLEGIALTPDGLSIVAVATLDGRVEKIEIATGGVSVLGVGLEFMPALPNFLPFQWSNDVAVDNDFAYVNVDGPTNAIYKFSLNPTSAAVTLSMHMMWTVMGALLVRYGLML